MTPEMAQTALDQLERARLLAAGGSPRTADQPGQTRLTRRALVAGAAVALAPVVISMLAPKPAAAATQVLISSRLAKDEICDIGDMSRELLKLRPVTFRYKPEYDDGAGHRQYRPIAEEVASIFPELAVLDNHGAPMAVRYELCRRFS